MTHSQLLEGLKCESQTEDNERIRSRGTLPSLQHYKGVEGRVGAVGWDQEKLTSFNYSHGLSQNQHKVVSAQLEHFWCENEPRAFGHTKLTTSRTWGKPPPSPLYYTLRLSTGVTSKWLFVPRLPLGSSKIPTTKTPTTLGAHNFLCRPLIAMRSKAKLQPLSRSFQQYVARWLHTR